MLQLGGRMQKYFSLRPGQCFESVFERSFDVVVCAAGFVGYWAAHALAKKGYSVLLVESTGDLLWEATRALEDRFLSLPEDPDFTDWFVELKKRDGSEGNVFDVALAEAVSADILLGHGLDLSILLYAAPTAVHMSGSDLIGLTVATKGGLRVLRARHWVDATEKGNLLSLTANGGNKASRPPVANYRSLVLHAKEAPAVQQLLQGVCCDGEPVQWLASPMRDSARRLRWQVGESLWHHQIVDLMRSLRAAAAAEQVPNFALTHCGLRDYPVYDARCVGVDFVKPANLTILSPALHDGAVATLEDRVALGLSVRAMELKMADPTAAAVAVRASLPPAVRTVADHDILVVGTGTAGALAAIAAGRTGKGCVLAVDSAYYPGGVGTGGVITSYFHGSAGGLQSEVDARTQEITQLLNGTVGSSSSWHHDAKKISLLMLFEEAGVSFAGDIVVCDVRLGEQGQRIESVLAVVDGELLNLQSRAFIDGTGDGDLAFLAGAEFVGGRRGDGRFLAYSQSALLLWEAQGQLHVRGCNYDAGWVNPADPEDLTLARLVGIAQYLRPQWTADDRPLAFAPLLGLRQSRQICSDKNVTLDDMVVHARFDDWVGEVRTVADSHSVDFEFESDQMMFYYWVCRAFKYGLYCELPYRMLLPDALANVWVPCRAAGMDVDASYGLRMQREMQRLGEAAGIAAGLSLTSGGDSRRVDLSALQLALRRSGATPRLRQSETEQEKLKAVHAATISAAKTAPIKDDAAIKQADEFADPIGALDRGQADVNLWVLYRSRTRFERQVRERLADPDTNVSFYAAAILAMWGDPVAEPRLLQAIEESALGPEPVFSRSAGAYGQHIDLPHWLQAVALLRCCGTSQALPHLHALAALPENLLNVRTLIAITLERIAERDGESDLLVQSLGLLLADAIPDAVLSPSRSLWRALQGEPQKRLPNDRGARTAQDHSWQLHLIVARTRVMLGLPVSAEVEGYRHDRRGFVRSNFESVLSQANSSLVVSESVEQ